MENSSGSQFDTTQSMSGQEGTPNRVVKTTMMLGLASTILWGSTWMHISRTSLALWDSKRTISKKRTPTIRRKKSSMAKMLSIYSKKWTNSTSMPSPRKKKLPSQKREKKRRMKMIKDRKRLLRKKPVLVRPIKNLSHKLKRRWFNN